MTQKPLRVVIGCDVDPDRPDFGGTPYNAGNTRQVWQGVECIPALRERLDKITDANGRPVAVTWLLRCDEQINVTEGTAAYLLRTYATVWERCLRSGDEIGWHPHFWRLHQDGVTWFQDIRDATFQKTILTDGFHAFAESWGKPPVSVRMGWDYQNTAAMTALADLGIRIDFSALPYQQCAGSQNDRGASFAGYYDWARTGTAPYFPSAADYQQPGELPLVELPNSVLHSKLIGFLAEARIAVRERSLRRLCRALSPGQAVATRSLQVCLPPPLFQPMVQELLARQEDWLVTYFHPDQLLPDKGQWLNNHIHRRAHFIRNMQTLLTRATQAGRPVEFLTAAEAAEKLQR